VFDGLPFERIILQLAEQAAITPLCSGPQNRCNNRARDAQLMMLAQVTRAFSIAIQGK
jgi:hypothetical protein